MHIEWTWQTPACSETLRLPLLRAQTTANPQVHFRKSSDECGLGLNSSFSTDFMWLNYPYLLGLCACPSRVPVLSAGKRDDSFYSLVDAEVKWDILKQSFEHCLEQSKYTYTGVLTISSLLIHVSSFRKLDCSEMTSVLVSYYCIL